MPLGGYFTESIAIVHVA